MLWMVVGGVTIHNAEEIVIAPVPPLQYNTQQSTKGTFWHVTHYQQMHQQLLFLPDAMLRQKQLPTPSAATQAVQRPVLQQQVAQLPVQEPVATQQQPTSSQLTQPLAKKKFKRS
jgi:hypothetical protein